MKLVIIIFLSFFILHEDPEWYAKALADCEAMHREIKSGEVQIKTIKSLGKQIEYCKNNKDWVLLTVLSDTIGFSNFKEKGFYQSGKLIWYEVSSVSNPQAATSVITWRVERFCFNKEKVGLYKKEELIIPELIPTKTDTLAINSKAWRVYDINTKQIKGIKERLQKISEDVN